MPRRRIRWTNCRPIKLRRGALDVLVAALRITPTRLPVEAVTDEWWQAVMNDPRARPRRPREFHLPSWDMQMGRPLSSHREPTLIMSCQCGVRKVLSTSDLLARFGPSYSLVTILNQVGYCKPDPGTVDIHNRCRMHFENLTPMI